MPPSGGFSTNNYWSSTENDSNNAWNLNFSSGSWNNNNKNNANSVRCVRSFAAAAKPLEPPSIEEIYDAYLECRRHKRSTRECADFEKHLFRNLGALHEEIVSLAWQPLPSRVFAVPHPKPREVWAAQFRDRIVHHWIVGRLAPRWVPKLIEHTYACLAGRGTHKAILDAEQSAARITRHWTREGWWLKFDIANFFGSIHLPTLWQMVEPTLADPWERRVLHQVLFCQQRDRPIVQDKSNTLHLVPPHKSLLAAPEDRGLPIGNLTSQFLANVYLHGMDETGELLAGKKRYLRYADDVLLLGGDLDALRDTMRQCEQAAADVRLAIHPGKTCFGRLHQGFDFVGFFALPGRLRLRRSTYRQHLRALRDPAATRQQRASRLGAIGFCSSARKR